jgi:hypothetical protein
MTRLSVMSRWPYDITLLVVRDNTSTAHVIAAHEKDVHQFGHSLDLDARQDAGSC